MKKDIYPRIGRLPIRSVTAADVLSILDRATKRGAEVVALNLRQWCSQVFRYAVATLRADHDPASALRGAVIRPPVNHSRPMDRGSEDGSEVICWASPELVSEGTEMV